MRVFRSTYRAKDGTTRATPGWYIEVIVRGRVRRMAAFSDKAASTTLGRNIERLAQHVEAGGSVPSDLARWIDALSTRIRSKLAAWGLLDPRRVAAGQPIDELLTLWHGALIDAGRTDQHARLSMRRAATVMNEIGVTSWGEVDAEMVQRYLARRRREGLSARSSNHMLTAMRGWCRWMVRTRRAAIDPLAGLQGLNVETDRRHVRRALTPSEARRLIRAAETSRVTVDCLTGPERALVYRVALGTGLRRSELERLRVGDFDLAARTVTLGAASTKNRRAVTLPLPDALCVELREWFAGLPPSRPALPLTRGWRSWRVLHADRKRAGIPRLDDRGRALDFHALRVTYVSWLAAGGAHPSVAQALARHSDGRLTQRVYTDLPAAQVEAVAGLPDLRLPGSASRSAVPVSGHVLSGATETGLRGQDGGGTGTRTQESRICKPAPGRTPAVDLSEVTSLALSDSEPGSAEELAAIRALVRAAVPADVLGAMEWAASAQEVGRG